MTFKTGGGEKTNLKNKVLKYGTSVSFCNIVNKMSEQNCSHALPVILITRNKQIGVLLNLILIVYTWSWEVPVAKKK